MIKSREHKLSRSAVSSFIPVKRLHHVFKSHLFHAMSPKGRFLVLYAGETGNSEDLAKRITWQGSLRHLDVICEPINDGTFAKLSEIKKNESKVLFICSTTGQGDVPRTMQPFWKCLMKKGVPNDHFDHLSGYIIGLGDSSYMKYNFVAKKLAKRLKTLGFNQLSDLALGDDQHDLGLDAGVEPFLEQLWNDFTSNGNGSESSPEHYSNGTSQKHDDKLFPATIRFEKQPMKNWWKPISPKSEFKMTTVIENQRVTTENHFQDVRLIRILLSSDLNYETGDVLAIEPENDPQEVDEFIALLNLDPNEVIHPNIINRFNVTSNSKYKHLPSLITIRDFVSKYLDIHSIPKKSFFQLIWKFSQDELERIKLREFSTKEGSEDYLNYCQRPRRTILEVLKDFPHTSPSIPLNYLPDLIPAMKPREFSIASSPSVFRDEIQILVAIVRFKTRMKKHRTGLCSNYLSNLESGDSISVSVRKGSFVIPPLDHPVILIGPGTGVAPLRALIQERVSKGINTNYLFFGCRREESDFYFKQEWENLRSGNLNLFVAFSRKDPNRKKYVQHVLLEQKDLIYRLILEENSSVIICGNSKQMPDNVRDAFVQIFSCCGGNETVEGRLEKEECERIVSQLETRKRIQYECWS